MANDFKSEYKNLMSNINIDDSMKSRILDNVINAPSKRNKSKIMVLRRIVPIAAAAVVLIFVGTIILNIENTKKNDFSYANDESYRGVAFNAPADEAFDGTVAAIEDTDDVEEECADTPSEEAFVDSDEVAEEVEELEYICFTNSEGESYYSYDSTIIAYGISVINENLYGAQETNKAPSTDSEIYYFELNYDGDNHIIVFGDGYILYDETYYIVENALNSGSELSSYCIENSLKD